MRKKSTPKLSFFLLLITTANLCLSIGVGNALDIVGNVTLTECTGSTCLSLTVPESLSLNKVQFLDSDGDKILVIFNYPIQALEISDNRTSGGFNVTLNITDLTHSSAATSQIDRTYISTLSFNSNSNEGISTDNSFNEASVISHIDPDLDNPDGNNLTYTEIVENYKTHPEWFYAFPLNEDGLILEAPTKGTPGYRDVFKMGMAFLIDTPPLPEQSLVDGYYALSMVYTLTST